MRTVRELVRHRYDAAVLAVAHNEFRTLGPKGVRRLCRKNHVVYDIKHLFRPEESDGRL
jgi:UDP-N-acetyl-D-galactosamine dehydrogenase